MKKILLLLVSMAVTQFVFSNEPVYPNYLVIEDIALLESEFVKKMDSEVLINDIESKFISLFDKVTQVNAQYSKENGYYYLVFGVKSNLSKIELLRIEEEDIINNEYSYINFEKIKNKSTVEFCGYNNFPVSNPCHLPFCSRLIKNGTCLNIRCGVWDGIQCQVY